MKLAAAFIDRPIGTSLLAAAILLLGIPAWNLLPVAPLPQVDFPTIQVSANLPGAGPEVMAATVATPLERQFAQIAGVEQMTSNSTQGSSSVNLQFALDRDIDAAALDVQAAITAAAGQLPTNMPSPPTYRKSSPADKPILTMTIRSDTLPLSTLSDIADNQIAQQLSQLEGVGQVNLQGVQKPAIRIQVDPGKLASLGLDLENVRAAIGNATVNAPKGTIDGAHQSFTVYTNDQILSVEPWNALIVAYRNKEPIRIRDIGVAVADAENVKSAAWAFKGQGARPDNPLESGRSVNLTINKQPGANVIETVERIKASLVRIRADLPPAVELHVLSDRTQTIRASVAEVELTLIISIILVVLTILLFLRSITATLIASATVPLALFGTAAAMYLCGYSLDNFSLMALTIAVGFVIDDAIVMLENIYRHIENGVPPLQAARRGAGEVGFTIISISVSLVAVFIPLLLMGGLVGRLFREFSITVAITIVISVVVSLTLTPMLCARYLKSVHAPLPRSQFAGYIAALFDRAFVRLTRAYQHVLGSVLRHQAVTLAVFVFTIAATIMLFVAIPKGFFPQQDTGVLMGTAEAAQDISFSAMRQRLLAVTDILRRDKDVDTIALSYGGGSLSSVTNTATMFISLKPLSQGRDSADKVLARLRRQVAPLSGITLYLQSNQDLNLGARSSRTQYQYTLTSADLDELNQWAPTLLDRLRTLPQLTDVATDQQNRAATAMLTIDRDRASTFGISAELIDATIYDAIGQRQVAQYFTQVNSYRVILEITPQLQSDPALFDKLYIVSPTTGQHVPLASLVKVDTGKNGFLTINHQGRFPAVTISFNLAADVSLGQAIDAIQRAGIELGMPAALHGGFQGAAQAFQSSLASQPYLITTALLAAYIVLGLLYESYIHPLTILSTLPSAGLGALLALKLGGFDFSVIALIAIILLIGIVKKNGIMMVDFALSAQRVRGLTAQQAIYEACVLRFRPIMMTTLCAMLAGVPLMAGAGAGAELRRPLGYAMVGGLAVSQVLTLLTTPVIYLYMDRVLVRYARWRQRHAKRAAHAPAQ